MGGHLAISVELGGIAEGAKIGDSIAVNGVCLTITRLTGSSADFDVSSETLEKSTMGRISTGAQVNLERAMSAAGRFGGHFVQGHVDGTGKIASIEKKAEFAEITFAAPGGLTDEMVAKGSVSVDGVSLTIARMDKKSFTVAAIPVTLGETTLGKAKIGDTVNIETDIITKTVRKQLEGMLSSKGGLTLGKLNELGF